MHARQCISSSALRRRATAGVTLLAALSSITAGAVDFGSAAPLELVLFYPGQVSWEKTLTASAHKGSDEIRAGDTCGSCHDGEEAELGTEVAKKGGFGGRASVNVQVRAVVEGGKLHWQISGPLAAGAPSVAIMLGTTALKSTAQAGCWAACHDDSPGMASDTGLKLGKYLARSRSKNTPTGGGTNIRPQAELDAALAAGEFLDLIEVKPNGAAERGPVLERFREHDLSGAGEMRTEGARWIAEIRRPLAAAGPGEIALQEGAVYHFGIAIHDPGVEHSQHLVSFGRSIAIGNGTADLVAVPQDAAP